jgi:hypothetical protein
MGEFSKKRQEQRVFEDRIVGLTMTVVLVIWIVAAIKVFY